MTEKDCSIEEKALRKYETPHMQVVAVETIGEILSCSNDPNCGGDVEID